MANDLAGALKGLKSEDIQIDLLGRVIITNPELNERIKDLGLRLPIAEAALDNVACCKNGYQCGCTGDIVDFSQRLTRGGRPG